MALYRCAVYLLCCIVLYNIYLADQKLITMNTQYIEEYNQLKANSYFGMFWSPPVVTPTIYDTCCNLVMHASMICGLGLLFVLSILPYIASCFIAGLLLINFIVFVCI